MNATSKHQISQSKSQRKSPQLLSTLVAVGSACGLATMPASALELGEIQVNSALGQPLRASIAYALNPNEQIYNYCIYVRPSGSNNGVPPVNNARISLTDSTILINGQTPVREPILGMQIAVDCAYTPNLVREYTVLIDPEVPVTSTRRIGASVSATGISSVPQSQPVTANSRAAVSETVRSPVKRTAATSAPISANAIYRVQPGDSASTIVSRVQGRTMKLWPAVDIVVAANPAAFVDQDMNRLIAGSELFIPSLVEGVTTTSELAASSSGIGAAEQRSPADLVSDSVETVGSRIVDAQPDTTLVTSPATDEAPAALPSVTIEDESLTGTTVTSELQPGDVIVAPFASGGTASVAADTTVDSPAVTVPVINVTPTNNTGTSGAWNWLLWLGGTGVALIAGLLLFGRTIRERFASFGGRATEIPGRRHNDDVTQKTRTIAEVDYEFEDTVNARAISLDADLGQGTGLNAAAEIDVAQDFGFSTAGQGDSDLDMEITEEAAREPEDGPTDIIPPNHREEPVTIVESEEMPGGGDTEEYDLSMIVDATKQPIGEYDATAKDLQAVRVSSTDGQQDDYTLSSAVDYQVLEQDYEEEFSATMALNAEMEQAAKELAERMAEADTDHVTTEMPVAGYDEKVTAELPVVADADLTAELTANLPTSFEAQNDSTAGDGSEITVEMYAAGSDVTVEMQVESGKVDTKRNKK